MKAEELNGTHLGKTVKISTFDSEVKGVLQGVAHECELIDDRRWDDAPRWMLGQPSVKLTLTGWGDRAFGLKTEVTIVEATA